MDFKKSLLNVDILLIAKPGFDYMLAFRNILRNQVPRDSLSINRHFDNALTDTLWVVDGYIKDPTPEPTCHRKATPSRWDTGVNP